MPLSKRPPPLETIGSATRNVIVPCAGGERLEDDPSRHDLSSVALSFSGGGWRAALAAAGVLRFLAEADLLSRVRWVSSVSGGSITNGLLAVGHERVAGHGSSAESVDEAVTGPLLSAARDRSLTAALLRDAWRVPWRTRTGLLADVLGKWLGLEGRLADLTDKCSFVFNAANETTGVRFNFDRDRIGDYVLGFAPTAETELRVADAVAMSAAVPGPFNAMSLPDVRFPCGDGADARIADGGAYDNLGLEAIDDLHGPFLVVVSAGGVFRTGWAGVLNHLPVVKDLKRAEALLYRQSTALRTRTMVERFKAWETAPAGQPPPPFARRGVLFGLATTLDDVPAEWGEGRPEFPYGGDGLDLACFKTTFNKVDANTAMALIYRGWWLAGATICRFHRDLLQGPLPTWSEPAT